MIKQIYDLLKKYKQDFQIQLDVDWAWYHDVMIITVLHKANKYRFTFIPDNYSNDACDEKFLNDFKEALEHVVNGTNCW